MRPHLTNGRVHCMLWRDYQLRYTGNRCRGLACNRTLSRSAGGQTVAACQSGGGLLRIPIDERHVRSLNLGVSAGVGLFEALRQLDGPRS